MKTDPKSRLAIFLFFKRAVFAAPRHHDGAPITENPNIYAAPDGRRKRRTYACKVCSSLASMTIRKKKSIDGAAADVADRMAEKSEDNDAEGDRGGAQKKEMKAAAVCRVGTKFFCPTCSEADKR